MKPNSLKSGKSVQIPLWTIVTEQRACLNCEFNAVQIPLWTIVTVLPSMELQVGSCVQIPLWTIVTRHRLSPQGPRIRSDSSMDDCNTLHGAPGAEVETGSDSSMDDCNGRFCNRKCAGRWVQIPLWTIVTGRRRSSRNNKMVFRFLYGRL